MKTLSIIVPTYNVQDYIYKCLSSLIVDTDDFEVIVIIDGSKDKSYEIARGFQEKYPAIFRVIEKENGNYGSCVNLGLSLAKGQYIKILDADDYFDIKFKDYLQFLRTIDVDLVLTDYVIVDKNDSVIRYRAFSYAMEKKQSIEDLTTGWLSSMHHATITYRSELLRNMSYRQTEGIAYTDEEWSSLPFSVINSFAYYPHVVYRYLKGRSGQTVDLEYKRNNMWMADKVALGLASRYEQLKNEVGPFNRRALIVIISDWIIEVYRHYLLDYPRQLNRNDLNKFDNCLLHTSEEIYKKVDNDLEVRKFGKFYYIKDYRVMGRRKVVKYLYYDILRALGEHIKGIFSSKS